MHRCTERGWGVTKHGVRGSAKINYFLRRLLLINSVFQHTVFMLKHVSAKMKELDSSSVQKLGGRVNYLS